MDSARTSLDELLIGPAADGVMRALMRDLTVRRRNGLALPDWAPGVLEALAQRADVPTDVSVIGSVVARVPVMGTTGMVPAAEAAALVGRTERRVRQLTSAGRVRHMRLGPRSLLVDIESLRNVIGRNK